MPAFKPYYIKPETIHVGDTVRYTWDRGDVRSTVVGKVASVVPDGETRTFYTEGGQHIFSYSPGRGKPAGTVTLLEPALTRSDVPLFDLDNLSEVDVQAMPNTNGRIVVTVGPADCITGN